MLPPKTHVLAALKRVSQTRRTCDTKLQRLVKRAIELHECGKYQQAVALNQEIAAHVAEQLKLGRTVDQAISALHKALLKEMAHRDQSEVTVTITVKGGTPKREAVIASQVTRDLQKSVKSGAVRAARVLAAGCHYVNPWVPAGLIVGANFY